MYKYTPKITFRQPLGQAEEFAFTSQIPLSLYTKNYYHKKYMFYLVSQITTKSYEVWGKK